MTTGEVSQIIAEALWLIIKVSAPMLVASLVIGLLVSIFQTATSIQEQTMTFVPKVIAIFAAMILLGNWMATSITEYIVNLWGDFNVYIR